MTTGLTPSAVTTLTARQQPGPNEGRKPARGLRLGLSSAGDTTVSWPEGSMNMMRTWEDA